MHCKSMCRVQGARQHRYHRHRLPLPLCAQCRTLMPMQTAMTQRQRGFTLIEAVMVITITGIVAAMVAIFIRTPIQSYFDLERRVEMTDTADTALRRIARDSRLALPNSVRV